MSTRSHAWGHNGQLKDNEIYGSGNAYSAEYWEYDARLLRRWNTDPITYEWQSTYACFNNNPIYFSDPLGLEGTNDGGSGGGQKPKNRGGRKKNSNGTIPIVEGDNKSANDPKGSTGPNNGTVKEGGGISGGGAVCFFCGPNKETTYGLPDEAYQREPSGEYRERQDGEIFEGPDGQTYIYWKPRPAPFQTKGIDFKLFQETVQRDHLPMLHFSEILLEVTAGFLVPGGTASKGLGLGTQASKIVPKGPVTTQAVKKVFTEAPDFLDETIRLVDDEATKVGGQGVNRIYSARELLRRTAEPGPFHNFPEWVNKIIFKNGTRTITPNYFNVAKPGLTNTNILYRYPGVVNGTKGFYEIGVRPSLSGRTEVIIHRFFNPIR